MPVSATCGLTPAVVETFMTHKESADIAGTRIGSLRHCAGGRLH
jgi:hypothetical protein